MIITIKTDSACLRSLLSAFWNTFLTGFYRFHSEVINLILTFVSQVKENNSCCGNNEERLQFFLLKCLLSGFLRISHLFCGELPLLLKQFNSVIMMINKKGDSVFSILKQCSIYLMLWFALRKESNSDPFSHFRIAYVITF